MMHFENSRIEPGDAMFLDSRAPHRCGPNPTGNSRQVLPVLYIRLSEGDYRRRHYADRLRSYPPRLRART